jgi:hypothetical protein
VPGGRAQRLDKHVVIDWIGRRSTVTLIETTPHYGGQRFWFCCPRCGQRARIMYSPDFMPALFWASASIYAANDDRKGDPPSRSTPERRGRKWESAGTVPAQTRRHATGSVAEAIFQMPAIRAEGRIGRGSRD